jgi:hypothetical protein
MGRKIKTKPTAKITHPAYHSSSIPAGLSKNQTPEGTVFHPAHTELLERLMLTENVHLGDVAVLYQLAQELKIAETIDNFSMKGGGLPAGLQLVLMSINHTIEPVSLNQFASWYDDTALPQIININSNKLNKDNLSSAMDGICKEIVTIQPPLRPDDDGENPLICVYGDTFFSF